MKQKYIWNHGVQEGILFLLLGGALLWHGLDAQSRSFNKDWSQSPYLFPILVAVLVGALSLNLLYQGVSAEQRKAALEAGKPKTGKSKDGKSTAGTESASGAAPAGQTVQVLVVLGMSLLYYLALAVLKIPYITFGILSWSLTVSNFEVCTLLFLIGLMLYLGVRRAAVLAAVPFCTTLFLSVAFRAMLHVLLP